MHVKNPQHLQKLQSENSQRQNTHWNGETIAIPTTQYPLRCGAIKLSFTAEVQPAKVD